MTATSEVTPSHKSLRHLKYFNIKGSRLRCSKGILLVSLTVHYGPTFCVDDVTKPLGFVHFHLKKALEKVIHRLHYKTIQLGLHTACACTKIGKRLILGQENQIIQGNLCIIST